MTKTTSVEAMIKIDTTRLNLRYDSEPPTSVEAPRNCQWLEL